VKSAKPYVAVASADMLGESATWSLREAALYWVDIRGPSLNRFDPASGQRRRWPLPELCGGVVPMAHGVTLALRHDLVHFDPDSASVTPLCRVESAGSFDNRLNEAKCDRSGRLWIGTMRDYAAATSGALYRIDGSLRPERVFESITIPNSLGFSPDGRTMYFADTREGVVRAYDYDAAVGRPGQARSLIEADALPGVPDGCAVDAEGHVWTTRFGAGCVVRVAPDGEIGAMIALPTSQPTSCALGGAGLRTLFITTARQRLSVEALRAQPEAGHLFAIEVEVPGLPEPEFWTERPRSDEPTRMEEAVSR
jgi:sugar lactone lactonase YvrE